jgi:hypothetical protein
MKKNVFDSWKGSYEGIEGAQWKRKGKVIYVIRKRFLLKGVSLQKAYRSNEWKEKVVHGVVQQIKEIELNVVLQSHEIDPYT